MEHNWLPQGQVFSPPKSLVLFFSLLCADDRILQSWPLSFSLSWKSSQQPPTVQDIQLEGLYSLRKLNIYRVLFSTYQKGQRFRNKAAAYEQVCWIWLYINNFQGSHSQLQVWGCVNLKTLTV